MSFKIIAFETRYLIFSNFEEKLTTQEKKNVEKCIIRPSKKNSTFFFSRSCKKISLQKMSFKINDFETRYLIFGNLQKKLTTQEKKNVEKWVIWAFKKDSIFFFSEISIILLKFLKMC